MERKIWPKLERNSQNNGRLLKRFQKLKIKIEIVKKNLRTRQKYYNLGTFKKLMKMLKKSEWGNSRFSGKFSLISLHSKLTQNPFYN